VLSSTNSASRFPVTTISAAKDTKITNHVLASTSPAAEPAKARSTNPPATATRSTTAMCFQTAE
jgi:hypothetical protein